MARHHRSSDRPLVMHVVGSLRGGGAERCVHELVPRLLARGVAAEIVSAYPPNLAPGELEALGCRVHFRSKRPGFDPAHCAWLVSTLASRRPAIVHTHMQFGKNVGRLAAVLAGVPVIVHTEHSPNPVPSWERAYGELLWRQTAAVVTFGAENAAIVRAREGRVKRIEIIRNGVRIEPEPTATDRASARARLEIDPAAVVFAIVATLKPVKNHALAFAALARIKNDDGPLVRLALFGDGPSRADLERLAATLGIAELVSFYGFRPDVVAMLPGVDALLSVSLREMSPMSMLEAMSAALPIVAAPHAGTHDIVEDGVTGAIVDWTVPSVAAALRRVRDDRVWREACGRAGRRRVERNHDIECIADRHVQLYGSLLETSRSRDVPRSAAFARRFP